MAHLVGGALFFGGMICRGTGKTLQVPVSVDQQGEAVFALRAD